MQTIVAEIVSTTPSYVTRIINGGDKVVNKTFVSMMGPLGYDVELTYVKRGKKMADLVNNTKQEIASKKVLDLR